jgi:hypothetical protein
MVSHDRGYLIEHYTQRQRGAIVTGKTMCDGSNQKPAQDFKTVKFTGTCLNCVSTVRREFTETYPGSLDRYGGVLVVNCDECGDEGDYCKNCEHNLHLEKTPNPGDPVLAAAVQAMVDDLKQNGPNSGVNQVDYEQKLAELLASQNGDIEVWVNRLQERTCPDGAAHDAVHRERQERPVVLTDNHIIKEAVVDPSMDPSMTDLGFRCSPDGPQREGD